MAAIHLGKTLVQSSALAGNSRKNELSQNPQLLSLKRTTMSRTSQCISGLFPLKIEARASCRVAPISATGFLDFTSMINPNPICSIGTALTGTGVGVGHRFTTASEKKLQPRWRHSLGVVKGESSSSHAATAESPQDSSSSSKCRNIWLSDVVATRDRPYFVNRNWTSKDITYVTYMGVVHALCLAAPFTFSWGAFAAFVILYFVTGCLGITLSYHRNLSHKSFKLPKWLEYTFAYCGILANQGDPIEWVSSHRYHHQFVDTDKDPHSPSEGLWHSHMGWILDDQSTEARVGARANVADMEKDPFYKFIQKTYAFHALWLAVVLFAIGGFPYVVWGMGVRLVWVYHITWAVNSACHVWGFKSWNTRDLSRNNWWVALLAFGEGWHNNHHAFEYSARHGLKWWQLDPTWYIVRALEAVGLATKVKLPSKEHKHRLAFATSGTAS